MSAALLVPEERLEYPNVTRGCDAGPELALEAEVVVVGTGTGGTTTALALAEAGHDVLLLEEGELVRTGEFTTDPMSMIRRLYRDAGTSVIQGRPPILFAEGRCVGGSSVINGGMCWRTPERVLEGWSGEGLPEIDARAMERHFARAEEILHVELQREETFGRHSRLFAEGARSLGLEMERNRRNMRDCVGLNNCALGCPTGAKQSMLVTAVPRALARGARLVTHARVRRIDFRGGRATGVRGRLVDARGRSVGRFRARAKLVVLAAGARHTPGILLRSRVRSPALGRHLKTHPNAKAVGVFDQDLSPWLGAHQTHQLHRFLDEGILIACASVPPGLLASALPGLGRASAARMRDYGRMLTAAVLVEDTGVGRVKLGLDREPVMSFALSQRDVELVHRGVALTARILFAAGAREVLLPFAHLPAIASVDEIARIESLPRRPEAIELLTVHIMGSARMAREREQGVCDAFGLVHGVPGLAVADASLFPSSVGVNPQESIMALALRNAEHWSASLVRA